MKLEITIDGGVPFYFPINKDVIILGSSSSADIKIPQMHISRKHLALHSLEEKFYVEDLGSTNGSFVNDEKLLPNQKLEFTSFFPVRMGSVVMIALVSDEEEDNLSKQSESLARAIPRTVEKSSDATMTQLHIPRKPENDARDRTSSFKRPALHKNKKASSTTIPLQLAVFALMIAGAGYYIYNQKVEQSEQQAMAEAAQVEVAEKEKVAAAPPPAAVPVAQTITDDDFIPRAEMETILSRVKCVTEAELALCNTIEGGRGGNWGATVLDEQMVIAIDGTSFYTEAKQAMPVPEKIKNGSASVAERDEHEDNIWRLAVSLFIKRSLSKLPYATLKKEFLVFGFFQQQEIGHRLKAEIVAQADQLQNVSLIAGAKLMNDVIAIGPGALSVLNGYYRFKGSELQ